MGKIHCVLACLLWLLAVNISVPQYLGAEEEVGFKFFKNYTYEEYDHYPQNWGIVQDSDGIIYVANQAGMLIYDGASWRVLGVPGYEAVRSLAVDQDGKGTDAGTAGTVFIGGDGKIGFLAADEKGSLYFVSLVEQLEKEQRNFSLVWRTHATTDGIYFGSYEYLFRWNPRDKKMKVWKPTSPGRRFFYSFEIDGRFFIQEENVGLLEMIDDSLKLLPGGEIFAEQDGKIFMIAPYDYDKDNPVLLIGARLKGFFLYDGKTMTPFPTGVDEYLKVNTANHGIRLSSGEFALAISFGGVIVMDSQGNIKSIYDKSSGLQDDSVKYLIEDKQGNLWLCLEKGITKIEYQSPFSIYDERSRLPGMVMSMARHNNDLFVGTTKGLYYLESPLKFALVPGMSLSCWGLLSVGDSLLAATADGVFQVDNKKKFQSKVMGGESLVLLKSEYHPGITWSVTGDRLVVLLQENGRWRVEHRFDPLHYQVRSMAEDDMGNLWLATLKGVIFKVEFPVNINQAVITPYGKSHGLPEGEIFVTRAAGHIVIATNEGVFRFDERRKRFISDMTLGNQFFGGSDAKPVFRLAEDQYKHIWFHSESRNYQAIPGSGGTVNIYFKPFLRLPTIQVNTIYPDPDGKTVWFGRIDGLFRFDKTIEKNYQQAFLVLIRKVLGSDRLIFDGYRRKLSNTSKDVAFILEYSDRNFLRFDFAAPFFEGENETRYQYFLEGFDSDWSVWGKASQRNYTNLDSGKYKFHVRAKNIYDHFSSEDIFEFKILLPWFRTWWAYISYFFLFVGLSYLIFKWQHSIRLEKEKLRLEQIVTERTKEIKDKNLQLEEQTLKLKEQSERLREMDKIKSRFFANISHEFRTPLTLIMSPVEEMLPEVRDKEHIKKLNLVQRSSQRLLRLINQLLDLSRIDSGKMTLQAANRDIIPFLRGIFSSFLMEAQHKKLAMELKTGVESLFLYFDAQKLEDIMNNLLMNALKFTPAGGKITVSVSMVEPAPPAPGEGLNPGFVEISVADTGIGIPKEQLPLIFDRFFQVQGSLSREEEHKGTGIGLALIKELVTLHRGKINVHSAEGKGSTFVVQLPLGKAHLKPEEIVDTPGLPVDEVGVKEDFAVSPGIPGIINGEEEGSEAQQPEPGEGACVGAGKDMENGTGKQEKNVILVVEDHDDVRKYIRSPLEQFYTVVEARNGQEGVEVAREIIPDLIVSDIMMPVKDGCELCKELKGDIKTSHIPIILLTAKASEESVIEGLETGADDYITKPFNTKMLLARIKNLIDLRRQMQLKIQRQKMLLPAEILVSSQDEKFLKEFQQMIEKNLADPDFDVDELCKKLYMGRSTLFRKVQALTGETPNQFILSYRLERGAQLLRENFGNVTEVAMEVGFSSPPYFAKCFKDRFHQSPSSFQSSQSKSS